MTFFGTGSVSDDDGGSGGGGGGGGGGGLDDDVTDRDSFVRMNESSISLSIQSSVFDLLFLLKTGGFLTVV